MLLNRAVKLVPPLHKFIIQEASYEKLLERIARLESPEIYQLTQFTGIDFFDHLARRIKASGLWLPTVVKNFGKRFLK